MTRLGLARRNLVRNRSRVMLTILGVAVAVVAFVLLRTVVWAWESGKELAATDRVVTRHKITFTMQLPKRYAEVVRQAPGIKSTTYASWFGGKDPNHEHEFFGTFAVEPTTYFQVYSEMRITPDAMERWKTDRQAAVVGDVLAAKLGWHVGERVTLHSGIYPGDWEFHIVGIYTASARSVDRSTFLFRYDYLNDAPAIRQKDQVGWIVSRVNDPAHAADVSLALDRIFESQEIQTLSQDERAFNASFLAGFSAVLSALDVISFVILSIMLLILGNTIAMGVRERTNEYGVLRAVGFLPKHIVFFVLSESLLLGIVGGVVGLCMAYPFINYGMARWVEQNMGAYFPYFRLEGAAIAGAVVVAMVVGLLAGAIPAWQASKLRVVDALRRIA
jgi:putative ABC transport system permease protein